MAINNRAIKSKAFVFFLLFISEFLVGIAVAAEDGSPKLGTSIGADIGATYPCVAVPRNDKELAEKIDSDDKEKMKSTLKQALACLDDNQIVEKDDFEEKLKEVEALCNPVIKQVYEKSGGSPSDAEDGEPNDEL